MLNENETFSAVLSDYTGRTVYNRGMFATGVPFFYYQLLQNDITDEIKDPEYIIYTLIDDHFLRLLTIRGWCKDNVLQYKYSIKDNNLHLDKPIFTQIYSLYSIFILNNFIQKMNYDKKEYEKIFLRLMIESNNLIKKKFPNTKFVILVYQDFDWKDRETKQNLLNHLEKEGIEIIYTNDLIRKNTLKDKKYRSSDNFHPSKEAWLLIVPKLVSNLKL